MDEYRGNVQKVQKALDQEAAFIQPNPYLAQRVLNATNRERSITVKRKMPIVLIAAIVLMMTSVAAVAATMLWQDYVSQVKETEHELGDYADWPETRRIRLAKDIVGMGYVESSGDTAVLDSETASEAEKAAAADHILLELTGLDDVKEIHSTWITYTIMGHEDTWTPEQRVWWNGIITMYGDDGATDTLIVPDGEVLSDADAIAIAARAVQEAYGFDDETMAKLHPVANLYVTDQRPDYKRWDIQFTRYREGSSTYVEKVYSAIVDEYGEVIGDPDVGMAHVAERAEAARQRDQEAVPEYVQVYLKYMDEQESLPFWAWTYQAKAAYSAEVLPLTQSLESIRQDIAWTMMYRYGLPSSGEVPYEQALALARGVLAELYGLTEEQTGWYSRVYEAFDITEDTNHMWKFIFVNEEDWYGTYYRVLLNAATGEVVLHEAFPWQVMVQDEAYAMKFY